MSDLLKEYSDKANQEIGDYKDREALEMVANFLNLEEKMEPLKVNRVELIDSSGRSYTKWESRLMSVTFSLQDDKRTLKIFVED
jgi:hypothetical protein